MAQGACGLADGRIGGLVSRIDQVWSLPGRAAVTGATGQGLIGRILIEELDREAGLVPERHLNHQAIRLTPVESLEGGHCAARDRASDGTSREFAQRLLLIALTP